MIELSLGKLEFAEGLSFDFPKSACCNCGKTSDLLMLKQDTRQTTYMGGGGTEITFQLPLPFCRLCAPSAKRRPKSFVHRLLMFAIAFGVAFLGLIILGDVIFSIPALSQYLLPLSALIASAVLALLLMRARPRGSQTSYYQPVRISKLKREFLSGKVVGIHFRFTNRDYSQLFESENLEVLRRELVKVDD